MSPDQEYVMRTIKSRDVHFVRFWFTDVMGRMK
jgi:glutamine synthetase